MLIKERKKQQIALQTGLFNEYP